MKIYIFLAFIDIVFLHYSALASNAKNTDIKLEFYGKKNSPSPQRKDIVPEEINDYTIVKKPITFSEYCKELRLQYFKKSMDIRLGFKATEVEEVQFKFPLWVNPQKNQEKCYNNNDLEEEESPHLKENHLASLYIALEKIKDIERSVDKNNEKTINKTINRIVVSSDILKFPTIPIEEIIQGAEKKIKAKKKNKDKAENSRVFILPETLTETLGEQVCLFDDYKKAIINKLIVDKINIYPNQVSGRSRTPRGRIENISQRKLPLQNLLQRDPLYLALLKDAVINNRLSYLFVLKVKIINALKKMFPPPKEITKNSNEILSNSVPIFKAKTSKMGSKNNTVQDENLSNSAPLPYPMKSAKQVDTSNNLFSATSPASVPSSNPHVTQVHCGSVGVTSSDMSSEKKVIRAVQSHNKSTNNTVESFTKKGTDHSSLAKELQKRRFVANMRGYSNSLENRGIKRDKKKFFRKTISGNNYFEESNNLATNNNDHIKQSDKPSIAEEQVSKEKPLRSLCYDLHISQALHLQIMKEIEQYIKIKTSLVRKLSPLGKLFKAKKNKNLRGDNFLEARSKKYKSKFQFRNSEGVPSNNSNFHSEPLSKKKKNRKPIWKRGSFFKFKKLTKSEEK